MNMVKTLMGARAFEALQGKPIDEDAPTVGVAVLEALQDELGVLEAKPEEVTE